MISFYHVEVQENLSSKRKASFCDSTIIPPAYKLPRLEKEVEEDKEEIDNKFNYYQYWKDPLPDINVELNNSPSQMLCD